jgi:fibronectin-binding autotransporter adhesin
MRTRIRAVVCLTGILILLATPAPAQRQMEKLGRGVIALRTGATNVYVGWRLLGTDPDDLGFNLYRAAGGITNKLNPQPLTNTTDYVDTGANLALTNVYFVRPVSGGTESAASIPFFLPSNAPGQQYLSIPLHQEAGDGTIVWGHVAVGDLDGDGEYDFVVNRSDSPNQDPANTHAASTDTIKIEGYRRDGTFLWRIDLGWNIEVGNDYAPMLVYDVNGDGIAEIITPTSEGTTDGTGVTIGDTDGDGITDYRDANGRVLSGPEFVSVFSGLTGQELARTNWIPRGNVCDWGDCYGNRVSRHLSGIAYLDGMHPSIIICRGLYALTKVQAWNFSSGALTNVWSWSSDGNAAYEGQANQNIRIADGDGDGKDEILHGALTLDHDGTVLYCTGLGHGDFSTVSDVDPDHPGLEMWAVHENPNATKGIELHSTATGAILWGKGTTNDTDRGLAADIDPRYRGYECYAGAGVILNGLYDCKGNLITMSKPSYCNSALWWDADLCRELMNGASDGIHVDKWIYTSSTLSNLLTTGTGSLGILGSGDVLGDWREEAFSIYNSTEIRIYTTTIPATNRLYCLMHDPVYRLGQVIEPMRNTSPPHPGFYLGHGMAKPPVPPVSDADLVWRGGLATNAWDVNATANWFTNGLWISNTIATVFQTGKSVLFDVTGATNPPVKLVGSLQPAAVKVHSLTDYLFEGAGSLAGTMRLVKAGPAKLTINTTNPFTGQTIVSEGTLLVNGSLDQSAVVVESRGTAGGSGRLGQGLTVQSGGGLIVGNGTNQAGTLTVSNNLTLAGDVICSFDLSDDSSGLVKTNDRLAVSGNLTLSGTNIFQITLLNTNLPPGTYTLITYSGSLNGSVTNLKVAAPYSYITALTNPPGQIALVMTGTRMPLSLAWRGAGGSSWDAGISSNWLAGSTVERFQNMDAVRFDYTGIALPSVNLTGTLAPASVTVNATASYTFAGNGCISGPTGLTKTNSGTLTILTTNDYTGVTTLGGGTLSVAQLANGGSPGALGAAGTESANLRLNAGTLRYTGPTNSTDRGATLAGGVTVDTPSSTNVLTVSGSLAGDGALIKIGSGTLTLSGVNSFLGGVTASDGTLALGQTTAAGAGLITLAGGTLWLNASGDPANYGNAVNVATASTIVVSGSGNKNQSADGSWSGNAPLSLNVGSTGTFSFRGNIQGYSGTITLTGAGSLRFYDATTGSSVAAFDLGTGSGVIYTRAGGTYALGSVTGGGSTILRGAGSTAVATVYSVGGNHTSTTFSGAILDGTKGGAATVAIVKTGDGTWTLTASNSYTAGTTINGGVLRVNNTTGSGTGTNAVTVNSGGTLGGTGIIGGAVTVNAGGALAPGASAGTLTISKSLTLNSDARLNFELGATNASDKVVVSGALALGGTLNVTNLAGFGTNTYTLIAYGGALSGTLPAIGTMPAGYTGSVITNTVGQVKLVVQAAPANQPVFTNKVTLTNGTLTLSGSGGTANGTYYVLMGTNLTTPLAQWQFIATNQFDTNGNFTVDNLVYSNAPLRFYRLQVP